MERYFTAGEQSKRVYKRRLERKPLSVWLEPSDDVKGNAVRISRDLEDFFLCNTISDSSQPYSFYVAIASWYPPPELSLEDTDWIILGIHERDLADRAPGSSKDLDRLLIEYSATSTVWKNRIESLREQALVKNFEIGKKGIRVRLLDVNPLSLENIYVTVDGEALKKHDEIQKKFGGGFNYTQVRASGRKGKGKARAASLSKDDKSDAKTQSQGLDDQISLAVRGALAELLVIRQNQLLPLPLPAHPITHVPFPPARIDLCEPVSQGFLTEATSIIVNRASYDRPTRRKQPNLLDQKIQNGKIWDDGDDTSNEKIFSAAENDSMHHQDHSEGADLDSTESGDDSSESSDDALQDMISMNSPESTIHAFANSHSWATATSRLGSTKLNGTSTPGSVFSNFTATTARQAANRKAKLFKTMPIVHKIPDYLLQPRPAPDEDEEVRVFVEMKTLMKVGCFSGDWVQLEATSNSWDAHLDTLSFDGSHRRVSKSVKIYGVSDLRQSPVLRSSESRDSRRRLSVQVGLDAVPYHAVVWMSPILLANLDQTETVSIIPLLEPVMETLESRARNKRRKVPTNSCPPTAQAMTLLRISTPLSTERALQPGIFTALKYHFEAKRRILKKGDLIALPVDSEISRMVAQPAGVTDLDQAVEELLLHTRMTPAISASLDIAWFRVGQIQAFGAESDADPSASIWGGAFCIEPIFTSMRQAGNELSKIPSAIGNPWQYYLGTRPLPSNPVGAPPASKYIFSPHQEYSSPLRRRLHELLAAATSPQAIQLKLDPTVILLHSTKRNIGKAFTASRAVSDLGLHVFDIDANDVTTEGGNAGDVKAEAVLRARIERAISCGPSCTATLLRHVDALTADRMANTLKEMIPEIRVIIATTTNIENVPDGIRSVFTHEIEISAPDEKEREAILRNVIDHRGIRMSSDVDLASVAVKSAALVAGDLVDIVDRAIIARQDRLEQIAANAQFQQDSAHEVLVRDVVVSGGDQARWVIKADFDFAVEAARKNFADAIGAPKIPSVSWEDVGGLGNVKDAVMETIQLPLERPELFAKGMKKRSGILFYGPPGTGKTLLAKAIATEFSLNFFSIKGPELLNMYIGESEANVRRVFQRARDARPCVVFFDELDSVAPKRGNQGDSGGVMDRIVSQLLAELDGMSEGDEGAGGVFVIGATNRPDLLDQALLRPGRFDKMLYLGIADTHDKQLTILEALTRKFSLHPDMSLRRVAESLPFTYTGADLYALCSDAMLKAITRQASAVDGKIKALPSGPVTTAYFFDHLATAEDIAVTVTEGDFYAAQRELVGSVR